MTSATPGGRAGPRPHRVLPGVSRRPRARALLAHRAAFTFPLWRVFETTGDPVADLREGRHDALAAALLTSAGLQPGRLGL